MSDREIQEEGRGTAVCRVCGQVFDTDEELTTHMEEVHDDIELDEEDFADLIPEKDEQT